MTMNCDTVRELAPAYVLGALARDEEQAVREHLATSGEPHPEFEAFGGVVQYLDETVELMEPPAALKARVLAAVAAEPQARASGATSERARTRVAPRMPDEPPSVPLAAPASVARPAGARAEPAAAPKVAPAIAPPVAPAVAPVPVARRRASPWRWLLGIAAVLVILGLAGWNVLLQMQLGSATGYDQAVASVLDLAARPGSQTAILSGDGGQAPRGIAALGSDGSVAVAMRDLQPTVGSEVYEAWLIAPGAQPAPIGDFQVTASGTASLTARATPASGATIALTHEAGPGATTPTLPIVSKGVATGPAAGSAPPG
jgi:anti-sigma-K factor RskA